MNTPEQEIEIAQQYLRETSARLSNFLKFYWKVWNEVNVTQSNAHRAVTDAIDEAVAKMEILKEALK